MRVIDGNPATVNVDLQYRISVRDITIRRVTFFFIWLILTPILYAQSPASIALRLCENFKERSSFKMAHKAVDDIQDDVLAIYLPAKEDEFIVETVVTVNQMGASFLNVAANEGSAKVWRDNNILVNGITKTAKTPIARGQDRFESDYRVALPPFQGDYLIKLEYKPTSEKRSVFVWISDEKGSVRSVDFRSDWDYTESYHYRFAVGVESERGEPAWRYPQEVFAAQFSSDARINDWSPFNGLMLSGLLLASDHFQSLDYKSFVEEHLNFFVKEIAVAESAGISSLRPPFDSYFRYGSLADYALQTVPFFDFENRESFEAFETKALNQLMYRAVRSGEGTLARVYQDSLTIWADDMYFGVALLCKGYESDQRRKYLEEAVKQVILYDAKLKERHSGLYRHGYEVEKKEQKGSVLSRANGWSLLAKTELLKVMPSSHPDREVILRLFRDQAEIIRERQSLEGRWHLVLNNQETYLETSATAMFVTAFAEGIMNDWLFNKEEFRKSTISGWISITNQLNSDGRIGEVAPDFPLLSIDNDYNDSSPSDDLLIGSSTVLLAAIAIDKLNQQ